MVRVIKAQEKIKYAFRKDGVQLFFTKSAFEKMKSLYGNEPTLRQMIECAQEYRMLAAA